MYFFPFKNLFKLYVHFSIPFFDFLCLNLSFSLSVDRSGPAGDALTQPTDHPPRSEDTQCFRKDTCSAE